MLYYTVLISKTVLGGASWEVSPHLTFALLGWLLQTTKIKLLQYSFIKVSNPQCQPKAIAVQLL